MSAYFDTMDSFGSLCTVEWNTPGLTVVVDQIGVVSQPLLAFGTKFEINPVSGDLIVKQHAGPNAGKSINLTQGRWT